MAEDHLEPLITECPHCSTRFRVTENQLQIATGKVRCGACLTVFQGIDHLVWEGGPGFESAEAAKHALDELLNELTFDDLQKEPSAAFDKEPSAASNKEPSAALHKEPSAAAETPAVNDIEVEPSVGTPDPLEAWDTRSAQVFVGHESDVLPDTGEVAETTEAGLNAGLQEQRPRDAEDLTKAGGSDTELETTLPVDVPREAEDQSELATAAADKAAEQPELETQPVLAVSGHDPEALATAPVDPLGLDQISSEVSFAPEPRRWWVGVAMALGVLALLGQVFWYQFESWGRDRALRPVYGLICDLAGCELPVLRELRALQTQKLLVRSHPELSDALIVDAVIVNDAAFAQPFPVLELRFTTIDGNLVARRGFKPEEYLAGELAGATLMEPKTPVRLALEIADPGGDAVNYFLSFR